MAYPCEYCGGVGCVNCLPWNDLIDDGGYPEAHYPEPTIEDLCGPEQQPTSNGPDRFGDRCECGKVRWLREFA